jgi:hypothetical protein
MPYILKRKKINVLSYWQLKCRGYFIEEDYRSALERGEEELVFYSLERD